MKECILLAGGFGTRLQSVVKDVPKCMADVGGKPFLYYMMSYLEREEFTHVILSLGYKSDIVVEWLSQNVFGFEVSYVVENEPLGTGGAIKYAMQTKAKSDSVFVMNGDTMFMVETESLIDFHQSSDADITLALKPMINFDRYGIVTLNSDGRIEGFNEKRFCERGLINGGVYLLNRRIFDKSSVPKSFSFEKDILEKGINDLKICGLVQDTYFIDIGIPDDYVKANEDFINLFER
ncbi:MAG: nucleotidyltransferase family protein [Dysgonomonas sp.]